MAPSTAQQIAIIREVEIAASLIRHGLGSLQDFGSGNDFYHLPLLTLSSGLERLMKTVLCYAFLRDRRVFPRKDDNAFPTNGTNGHDLGFLWDLVVKNCYQPLGIAMPTALREDCEFFSGDSLARTVLGILSRFGSAARYYHLDVVLDNPKRASAAPEDEWMALETAILRQCPDWGELLNKERQSNKTYEVVKTELTMIVERFARALSRLFTLGKLGPDAGTHTGTIGVFLELRDRDLGKRDWR